MSGLVTNLATSLATNLGTGLISGGRGAVLPFSLLSYANASPRLMINPDTGLVTSFGAGVPAIGTRGGRRYFSSWRSLTNNFIRFASWTDINTSRATNNTVTDVNPDGTTIVLRSTATEAALSCANVGNLNYTSAAKFLASCWVKGGTQGATACVGAQRIGVSINSTNVAPSSIWQRVSCLYAGAAGADSSIVLYNNINNNSGVAVIGDNYRWWGMQCEDGALYPGRPIPTSGAAVTTAKDQAYYPAALVPLALRERQTQYFYPEYSSAQLALCAAGSKRYLWRFIGGTGDTIGCYILSTDRKIYAEVNGADVDATAACTWSQDQIIRTAFNRAAGTIAITGLTTGNDVLAFTPPALSTGDLILGMNDDGTHTVMDSQGDGGFAEPEIGL